jgi:hypothetical protein
MHNSYLREKGSWEILVTHRYRYRQCRQSRVSGRGESPPLYSNNEATKLLVPKQSCFDKLEPNHDLEFKDVYKIVHKGRDKAASEYTSLIITNKPESEYKFDQALKVYEKFHMLHREKTWATYPWGCTCMSNYKHTLCKHSVLFNSVVTNSVSSRFVSSWYPIST